MHSFLKLSRTLKELLHCVKSVRIRSYSGQYFPTFGLKRELYGVSLRIQSKCRKIRTRITPNTVTFYPMIKLWLFNKLFGKFLLDHSILVASLVRQKLEITSSTSLFYLITIYNIYNLNEHFYNNFYTNF